MRKIREEQLAKEKAEYEKDRQEILDQAERDIADLTEEHVAAVSKIMEIGTDVLSEKERELFGKE